MYLIIEVKCEKGCDHTCPGWEMKVACNKAQHQLLAVIEDDEDFRIAEITFNYYKVKGIDVRMVLSKNGSIINKWTIPDPGKDKRYFEIELMGSIEDYEYH